MAENKKKKRIKWWHITLIGFGMLILLFATWRITLDIKVDAALEEIREAGFPTDLQELEKWYGELTEDVKKATDKLVDALQAVDIDHNNVQALPIIGEAELPEPNQPMDPNIVTAISEYLTGKREVLEAVTAALEAEEFHYPLNYDGGFTSVPYLRNVRNATRLLDLRIILAAENGNIAKALDNMDHAVSLGDVFVDHPNIVSQLVRIAVIASAVKPTERILSRNELDEGQLAKLNSILNRVRQDSYFKRALIGERASMLDGFYHWFGGYDAVGLVDYDALLYMSCMKRLIVACDQPPHTRLEAAKELDSRIEDLGKLHILLRMIWPAITKVLELENRVIADVRCAKVAVGIERYRLDEGHLPADLETLVGGYIEEVPVDPFTGKGLIYKRQEHQYVVYSVGADLADDGGDEDYDIAMTVYLSR